MTLRKYERKFRELSEFALNMISDKVTKMQRFIDGLNEDIALYISGATHLTYQSARDEALEVKR